MKRPEKKKELGTMSPEDVMEVRGWNRACDDHDKFLPNEDEIRKEIDFIFDNPNILTERKKRELLAKAIAKRLGVK